MSDKVTTHYDFVVIGTGIPESIISAALVRANFSVLHLDDQLSYGSEWQSLNLADFVEALKTNQMLLSKSFHWWISEEEQNALLAKSRHFSIDFCPKYCFSKSSTVSYIIQSDVTRYLEFIPVGGIFTLNEAGLLEQAPIQRREVFRSKQFPLSEKHALTKFAQWCMSVDLANQNEVLNVSFKDILQEHGLKSLSAQRIFTQAVATSHQDVSALEGIRRIQRFVQSCGVYNVYPWLYPRYGSSELCQSFCRHSAVWGTVFNLNNNVDYENITLSGGEKVDADHLIMNTHFAKPEWYLGDKQMFIARAVFLSKTSWVTLSTVVFEENIDESNPEQEKVRVLSHSLPGFTHLLTAIELPFSTRCVPQNLYLVHMTLPLTNAEHANLSGDLSCLFMPLSSVLFPKSNCEDTADVCSCLFSAYFVLRDFSECVSTDSCPNNVHLLSTTDTSQDFDSCFTKAEQCFAKLCPDKEFLPRPPAQEDLVFGSSDTDTDAAKVQCDSVPSGDTMFAVADVSDSNNSDVNTNKSNDGNNESSAVSPSANDDTNESSAVPPSANNGNNESSPVPLSANDDNNESSAVPPSANNGNNESSAVLPSANDDNNESSTVPPSANNDNNESSAVPLSANNDTNNLSAMSHANDDTNNLSAMSHANDDTNNLSTMSLSANNDTNNLSAMSPSANDDNNDSSAMSPSANDDSNNSSTD